jgi:hypothetical protein
MTMKPLEEPLDFTTAIPHIFIESHNGVLEHYDIPPDKNRAEHLRN